MKPGATTSISLIHMLLNFISSYGINPQTICKSAGLTSNLLENMDGRVPHEKYEAVWKEALLQTGDPNLGLHFGEQIGSHGSGHILFYVTANCPDLGTALEKICRYHCLLSDGGRPQMKTDERYGYFITEHSGRDALVDRHTSEAIAVSMVKLIPHLTNQKDLQPLEVRFQHPRPGDITEHERIFHGSVRFGQVRNEIIIHRRHLRLPLCLADAELLETLESHASKMLARLYPADTLTDKVSHILGEKLRGETPDIDSLSRTLGMSTRNLQNKLKKEGTTYQKLLDQARKEIALAYLKNPDISMVEIALLLGYAEQSAFNHAFKRWTGSTPQQYRQQV